MNIRNITEENIGAIIRLLSDQMYKREFRLLNTFEQQAVKKEAIQFFNRCADRLALNENLGFLNVIDNPIIN